MKNENEINIGRQLLPTVTNPGQQYDAHGRTQYRNTEKQFHLGESLWKSLKQSQKLAACESLQRAAEQGHPFASYYYGRILWKWKGGQRQLFFDINDN
jgi:hypothetical protein